MKQSSDKTRFHVVNTEIEDLRHSVLIGDFVFWTTNQPAIEFWCETMFNKPAAIKGMFVMFDSDEDRTLFLLRWQNG